MQRWGLWCDPALVGEQFGITGTSEKAHNEYTCCKRTAVAGAEVHMGHGTTLKS